VRSSALPAALRAAQELLMLESTDAAGAAVAAVGDFEPGVTTKMSPAERAVRERALAAMCPAIKPHTTELTKAIEPAAAKVSKVSISAGGSPTEPSPGSLPPPVQTAVDDDDDDAEGPLTPTKPDPIEARTYWAFRSPAQRHAVAGLLTPAQVRTVCKLAARKLIMDRAGQPAIPFAEALDVIVLLHRSGDRRRRDDALVSTWAFVQSQIAECDCAGMDADTAEGIASCDDRMAVLQDQESLLALLGEIFAVDFKAVIAKVQARVRKQRAAEQAAKATEDTSSSPPAFAGSATTIAAARRRDSDAESLVDDLPPPRRRNAPQVDFHAPSMPTVVEVCKNVEPPLVLGPIAAALRCAAHLLAHRTVRLSPQAASVAQHPEPPSVPREQLAGLLDVFERVVPRTTEAAHAVAYTAAEEAAALEELYSAPKDYGGAVARCELLIEYVEKAALPRARRLTAFAHQLREFDVVVPRAATRLAREQQQQLLANTAVATAATASVAAAADAIEDDDADAMSDLGALRRGFRAVAALREDTDETAAIEATRDALMALAVCNWSAPAGHSRMTPAGLREALQQQWLEPLELKAVVMTYMLDVAVRRKWRVSYLVDAECQVV